MSIDVKKQQSLKKFFKGLNAKTTPKVIHICDVESNEPRISMPKWYRQKDVQVTIRITFEPFN